MRRQEARTLSNSEPAPLANHPELCALNPAPCTTLFGCRVLNDAACLKSSLLALSPPLPAPPYIAKGSSCLKSAARRDTVREWVVSEQKATSVAWSNAGFSLDQWAQNAVTVCPGIITVCPGMSHGAKDVVMAFPGSSCGVSRKLTIC